MSLYKHVEATNPRTARVEAMLERYYGNEVQICPERSHLATLSWKESEGLPLHLRRAILFEKICKEIPIEIFDNELIVGSQTHHPRGVGLQLDYSSIVGKEVEAGDRRLRADQAVGYLSEEDLKTIVDDTAYWRGRAPGDVMLSEIEKIYGKTFVEISENICKRTYGKVSLFSPDADFAKILKIGLRGIIKEIEEEDSKLTFTNVEDGRKHVFYEAAKLSLEAAIALAHRYADLAREKAAVCADAQRKEELLKIAEVCERVPEFPASSYYEALQCVRFIHLCVYFEEGNGSGCTLGRADQYLYPYYREDVDSGRITLDEAAELFANFWVKVAATDAIVCAMLKQTGAGYLNTRVVLAGYNRAGEGSANELTYLILHVVGKLKLGLPVYLRWYPGIPRELMRKALWTNEQIGSEPSFHNDLQTIAGLVEDGASIEDARDYVIHGCAHPFPYGAVYGSYHYINGGKVMELVMHDGVDPRTGIQHGVHTGDPREFKNIEEWKEAFKKQWKYLLDIAVDGINLGEQIQMQVYSVPFASALFPDCIKKGMGVHEGGGRYYNFTGDIYTKTYADNADSLIAIEELVYKQKKLTIDQIIKACDANFEGEENQEVYKLLSSAPKYGNALGAPEEMFRWLNDMAADMNHEKKNYMGYPHRDAKLGGAVHVNMGRIVGALPNGRKAGTPLSDGGVSPCAGCDTLGPTVTVRSAAAGIDYSKNRSSILNMKIGRDMIASDETKDKVIDLAETFFEDFNGYQMQWNVHNQETLIDATVHPKQHKDLIVRVGGFSAYFIELDKNLQGQIIDRTVQHF